MKTKTKMKTLFNGALSAMFGSALLLGCSDPNSLGGGDYDPGADPGAGADSGTPGTGPACSEVGKTYLGFGGSQLSAARLDAVAGADRDRMKPFSSLQTEYQRVLVNQPASLAASGPTFGQPAARWYTEPQANAVSIYQAFTVAFDGCLTYTATPPQYAAAPTAASAPTECAAMARKFWSRNATPDEIAACVNVATVDASKEADAKRKWAYTCAAVMTSAGFVTY
jgi:hypothetical protein